MLAASVAYRLMQKQLNIRSDEAYDRAQRLAKRLGTTTTEAVVRALRRYDQESFRLPTYADLTTEERRDYEQFMALAGKAREEMENPAFAEDDLYDEMGLPK